MALLTLASANAIFARRKPKGLVEGCFAGEGRKSCGRIALQRGWAGGVRRQF
jgi:hypothetical protein